MLDIDESEQSSELNTEALNHSKLGKLKKPINISILCGAIVLIIWHLCLSQQINTQNAKYQRLANLQHIKNSKQQYHPKEKELWLTQQIAYVDSLQNTRSKPAQLLITLSANLPKDLVLNSIKQENIHIILTGNSKTLASISALPNILVKFPWIETTTFKEIKHNANYFDFTLDLQLIPTIKGTNLYDNTSS